eukprot:jgi/Chlat1/1912/Chrsp149S08697
MCTHAARNQPYIHACIAAQQASLAAMAAAAVSATALPPFTTSPSTRCMSLHAPLVLSSSGQRRQHAPLAPRCRSHHHHRRRLLPPLASSSQDPSPSTSTPTLSEGGHKHAPRVFYSEPGERFLFQYGESLRTYELPAGTRVVYGGVRKDGTRDPQQVQGMIDGAINNPLGMPAFREKIRQLKADNPNPKICFAFDDVSIPLPPMKMPDIRARVLETCEAICVSEGVTDITYIRPDEFRHICGPKLFNKYHPERMRNYNAVDEYDSVVIGTTRHGEPVKICKTVAEASLLVYANVNYVSMDGGYKSYATGLVFHIETVLDEQLFPWYLSWVSVLIREMNLWQKTLMHLTLLSLRFTPLWLRMRIFWSPLVRGPFGLLQASVPLCKKGGVVIVINPMPYEWSSPAHDCYKELFEEVIKPAPGLDEFEAFQEQFATSDRLNDIYRQGKGPAGVHGFYMYTWAAHGMDSVSKVIVVGAQDSRGPNILRWDMADDVIDAVAQARRHLKNPDATVTYLRAPPLVYVRVKTEATQDTTSSRAEPVTAS